MNKPVTVPEKMTAVATATENKINTVEDLVLLTKSQNSAGGEINLSEIAKRFKKLNRHELLESVRTIKGTKLCVGRRGNESRVVWGDKIPAHMTKSKTRSIRKRITPTEVKSNGHTHKINGEKTEIDFNFKVCVGTEQVNVPVCFQLEKVA